ncbi:BPL-N domain-containing protein [Maioricimonas sp. JC845]|uniref:BPL-N domain-containing protein n=1 Tax=Maioricimonas sp. JC845 TaxID=3232138 RepID=UPI00345ABB82
MRHPLSLEGETVAPRQNRKDFAGIRCRLPLGLTLALLLAAFLPVPGARACTTAVISGRATADGRPILWKNRDAPISRNEVRLFTDGPLRAIAVVNAGSSSSVWMGMNEAGFCIENSLSSDLKDGQKHDGPGNGALMKRALLHCRTVDDFRKLLEETGQSGRRTTANFGVIDAHGGAAMFETSPTAFTMFDANDPATAPAGYIVRSNFATTARDLPPRPNVNQLDGIYSAQRYLRACRLIDSADESGVTIAHVLRRMARDLAAEDGTPCPGSINGPEGALPSVLSTVNTISRATSVSAAVFTGVRPGENPRLTTMWTILGDPKFSIAVPCWVHIDSVADPLAGEHGGEIGEAARTLRDASVISGTKDIMTDLLPGIWEDLWPLEDELLDETTTLLDSLRTGTTDGDAAIASELTRLHHELAARAWQAMQTELTQARDARLHPSDTLAVASTNGPVAEGTVRVAIYDHSDGKANGPNHLLQFLTPDAGFDAQRVTPEQIREGILSDFDVVIMPGGSGSSQAKHLEEAGRDAVRTFVSEGGGYVGICAGAYLASSHYSWSLGLINARVWDRAHWARGNGQVVLQLAPEAVEPLRAGTENLEVRYAQGPLLVPDTKPDLPGYEVLATFDTEVAKKGAIPGVMCGTHAIVRSVYGKGRVICFSPHPEVPGGPNRIMAAGIRWAARPDAE